MAFYQKKLLDIFLMIITSLFLFALITTLIYNRNLKSIEKLSNQFYDDDALYFSVESTNFDFYSLYTALPSNSTLYHTLATDERDIRGLVFKGEYISPKLKEGRCFQENDFSSSACFAMIGCDVTISKEIGEKKYITFNGLDYEIVGIIGYGMSTKLDQTILLTLNDNNIRLSNKYIISSRDKQRCFDFLGNESLFGQVLVRNMENVNIVHVIDRSSSQLIVSIILLSALLINCMSIMFFWVKAKESEIKIMRNNGYRKYQIAIHIWKDYAYLLLVGGALSIGGAYIYDKNLWDASLSISIYLPLAMLILAFFLLSWIIVFFSNFIMRTR